MNMAKLFSLRKGTVDNRLVTYTICFRRHEECMFSDDEGRTFIKENTVFLPLYDIVEWDENAESKAWEEFDYLIDKDAAELVMIFDNLANSEFADMKDEYKINCRFVSTWLKRAIYDRECE